MDCPQIGPKNAIKLGKKRQKDKWYPFRAPTVRPSCGHDDEIDDDDHTDAMKRSILIRVPQKEVAGVRSLFLFIPVTFCCIFFR